MNNSITVNLIDEKGNLQYGLNWGHRDNRNPDQSYIQLPPNVYKSDFFPKKGKYFAVRTDDGQTIIMTRAQKTDDGTALQTPDDNSIFGQYIRSRLGLEDGALITEQDILRYGRTNIVFTKIDDTTYEMDFNNGSKTPNRDSVDRPLQLIYYGAPGTGKSFTINQATNEKNSVRTTFHPDSDYAGFVGAYKPTMENVAMSAVISVGAEPYAKYLKKSDEHPGSEKKIVYKYVPQAFLKAYVEAWKRYSKNKNDPYYLIIEEINRGNCAQIFGDLFQLLDRNNTGSSSYPIQADEDIGQFLREDKKGFAEQTDKDSEGLTKEQRTNIASFVLKKDCSNEEACIGKDILEGRLLVLPPNLHIWATMNTSDQSLFPIDSAFKRRWDWEYMPIEYNKKNWVFEVSGKRYLWGEFLKKINPDIFMLTESADKQMGYFFAKPDKKSNSALLENDVISEKVFVNKVLFYLWTDVLKDYELNKDPFVYEIDDHRKTAYRFTDFFPIEHNSMLTQFVNGLGLTLVDELQDEDELEEQNSDEREDTSNLRLTIKFPNGKVIQEPTRFESFLKALEEIGLDKAEPIAAEKKYKHKNAALISKNKSSEIETALEYSYVQSGDYYVVKGTNTRTQRNLLTQISDRLNLGLEVSVE